jgi:hypothetical protein
VQSLNYCQIIFQGLGFCFTLALFAFLSLERDHETFSIVELMLFYRKKRHESHSRSKDGKCRSIILGAVGFGELLKWEDKHGRLIN